ncbi:MAG: glycosyltransferase family 2 protein [Weissella confusa]
MEKLLTIVIPSYNAAEFLTHNLDQLVNVKRLQEMEILIVNDGSNDDTAIVGSRYENDYPESVRLINKQNGGHGSTINVGIQHATGKYFKVVDADDWLNTESLDDLIEKISDLEIDLILTPYVTVDAKNGKMTRVDVAKGVPVGEKFDYSDGYLNRVPEFHMQTIRTKILQDNNIRMDENTFYVDAEFILYATPYVNSIQFFDIPLYYYQINQGTQSTSQEVLIRNGDRHLFVIRQIVKHFGKNITVANGSTGAITARISQMIASQYKIISMTSLDVKVFKQLRMFDAEVRQEMPFNPRSVNIIIQMLYLSRMMAYPVVYLAAKIQKMFVRA